MGVWVGDFSAQGLHTVTAGHVMSPNRINSDSFHFQLVTISHSHETKSRPQFPHLGGEGVTVGCQQFSLVGVRTAHYVKGHWKKANLAHSSELSVVAQAASLRAHQKITLQTKIVSHNHRTVSHTHR